MALFVVRISLLIKRLRVSLPLLMTLRTSWLQLLRSTFLLRKPAYSTSSLELPLLRMEGKHLVH